MDDIEKPEVHVSHKREGYLSWDDYFMAVVRTYNSSLFDSRS